MFVASNFLTAVARVLDFGLDIYWWIIIARAVLSWVNPDPYNPIVRFLYNATEPVLYRIRRTLPFAYAGGLDLSPLFVLAGIMFLQIFLVRSLLQLAVQMQ
jgi:YggT family protein